MERRRTGGLPVHISSGLQSQSSSRYLPGTKALVALNLAALLLLNLRCALRHAVVTPQPASSGTSSASAIEIEQRSTGPFPKVLHQMHASLSRLSPLEVLLSERCRRVNADFEYRFWTDESIDAFIAQHYAADHGWWSAMAPPIKRADTSRYFLLHFYGGAYVDLDVDCIRPISQVAWDLPSGTAWLGGYPEPFQVMSDAGNAFWLAMVDGIKATLDNADPWYTTGPHALNEAAKRYVAQHGRGVLMPWRTFSTAPAWLEFIGPGSNMSVPWFEDNHRLLNDTRTDGAGVGLGFWPNQVVDPGACAGSKQCDNDDCSTRWPQALYAHRCTGTWRVR